MGFLAFGVATLIGLTVHLASEPPPKLKEVMIPKLEIRGKTAQEALTAWMLEVEGVGRFTTFGVEVKSTRFPVYLSMKNVDALSALKEIGRQAGLTYVWAEDGELLVSVDIDDWTNAEGRGIKARFCGMEGGSVVLGLVDGRKANVPLDSLSEESRNKATERWKALKPHT